MPSIQMNSLVSQWNADTSPPPTFFCWVLRPPQMLAALLFFFFFFEFCLAGPWLKLYPCQGRAQICCLWGLGLGKPC